MTVRTTGQDPQQYSEQTIRELVIIVNQQAAQITREATQATPVGVGGLLRQSWVLSPATATNPVAIVGSSREYLLPVEMGRAPGKGVSRDGQEAIALWAQRKLGTTLQEGKSLAFLLSQRYKSEGRPAQGFLGLAKPGSVPTGNPPSGNLEPVRGSLLDRNFRELDTRLQKAPRT